MTDAPRSVVDALLAPLTALSDISATAPREPGLYAWWAPPSVLRAIPGPPHPTDAGLRLLYVGLATDLGSRLTQNHMRRTGSSTLRRTLAGLLLDQEGYQTRLTDRVILADESESRLTAWMTEHLYVSWCTHPEPQTVEAEVIKTLRPPLNVNHASGPVRDAVIAARRRLFASP